MTDGLVPMCCTKKFKNSARESICSVDTFKDLDSHNEKVTLKEDRKSWNKKNIDRTDGRFSFTLKKGHIPETSVIFFKDFDTF